jgi:hypothetical protein
MVKRNCRDELMEFRGGPAEIRHRYCTRSQAGEELAEARIFGPPIEEAIGSRDAEYVAPRKKPRRHVQTVLHNLCALQQDVIIHLYRT